MKLNPSDARGISIGIELVLSVLLGLFVGRWLDQRMGTQWITLAGILLGSVAGFRSLYRHLQTLERKHAADMRAEEEAEAREAQKRKEQREARKPLSNDEAVMADELGEPK